mmetsp:Transcript_7999/g.25282  ORF Transcript_7999/g.25282 Transcript_7999/m.25282 type:complete len:448 (+) Transcript_7999:47-1390(+)
MLLVLATSASLHTAARARPPTCVATAPPVGTSYDTGAFDAAVMKTYNRYPLAVAGGEGCELVDLDGRRYLDFAAGISTCTLGHANPKLAAAVAAQMGRVNHVSNLYYIPEQGELAQRLVATCNLDKVFFCNSGAEANEGAIKLARKRASLRGVERPVIITAKQSFHGRTLATLTATGQPKYQEGFGPLPDGFEYVEYNDVDELRALVKSLTRPRRLPFGRHPRRLAAILLEPLQGEGGIRPGDAAFFQAARQLCDEHDALLMVDEVQSGVCRSGAFWGHQRLGVEVDVLTSAKALGGGVPIGAMMCKASCDVLTPGTHASTFGGNPLACAAANAVLQAIEDDGVLANVNARSAQLVSGLEALRSKREGVIAEVRGWGLLLGVELTAECGFTAAQLTAAAMRNGLLTVPAGEKVLRLVPPLIVSAEQADRAVGILDASMAELMAGQQE